MGVLETLSLAMGTAWTSGINVYATVAILGLADRFEMFELPPELQILAHPLVIGVACVMYVIEFFADKIPYVDNGWDAFHTFIRIPAGAILAARSVGEVGPALEVAAVLAGGTVALAAHGSKATVRLAINASPEPFSNWFASVGEDVAVLGGVWLMFNHPLVMLVLVVLFLIFVAWLVPKVYRLAKRGFHVLRSKFSGKTAESTPGPSAPTT
jgi:hypothetical protein